MTTIKATCPSCGEVGLTPSDIDLQVDDRDESAASYAFTCPACYELVRKPADQRVVRLLASGGVEIRPVEPILPPHPEAFDPGDPRHGAPAICHDDILDFHALLADDDAVASAFGSLISPHN